METILANPAYAPDPEAALTERMAAGDESALRALYAAYGRRLYAYARRLTGEELVAEEVLQDSLLAAWRGACSYRGESRLATWLLGIVHRQALNAMRRKRLPAASLEEAAERPDEAADPEHCAEASDRRQTIRRALSGLSVEHRAVLELAFYQGLGLTEIAQVCRCPVGTVKSRLSYAKAHLRRALEGAGLRAEDLL